MGGGGVWVSFCWKLRSLNPVVYAKVFGTQGLAPSVARELSICSSGSFLSCRTHLPPPGGTVSKKLVSHFEVHPIIGPLRP